MSYSEVVEERDGLRVRLVLDDGPSEPYDDGGSPLLRLKFGDFYSLTRWAGAEQVTEITSYVVDDGIIEAAARWWAEESDVFERYLRAFHGTTEVKWYDSRDGDYAYVTFDTADWRAEMGLTDEYLASHAGIVLADMTEWRAYVEGDVYGYVVERLAPVVDQDDLTYARETLGGDARYDDVVTLAEGRAGIACAEGVGVWVEVEDGSLWGLYGTDYAVKAAYEAFDAELAEIVASR